MCGRFILESDTEAVIRQFELDELPELELEPRYNIAPTQPVPAVRADRHSGDGKRRLVMLRWGLVPRWADDPSIGNRMINARSESAHQKNAFKAAMKYRRCLIPANGFYEWQKRPGGKQPYFIGFPERVLFALAGLWEHWQDADGNELETCTILTTDANAALRSLHDRMPVILPEGHYDRWLDPEQTDPESLLDLLRPFDPEPMTSYPISTRVNKPAQDDASLVEPVKDDDGNSGSSGGAAQGELF